MSSPIIITSEQLTVAGAGAELRRNYHRNPGAEGTTVPLEAVVASTITRATSVAGTMPASGAAYFDLTATATTTATARTKLTERAACAPGQVWGAKIAAYNAAAGSRDLQLSVVFYDAAPGAVAGSTIMRLTRTIAVASSTATEIEAAAVAPAGALSVGVEITRASGSIGDRVLFDQLQLEQLPAGGLLGPYFDGDTLDTAEAIYSWAGSQYDSDSILRAPARASTTPALMLELVSVRQSRTTVADVVGSAESYTSLQPSALRRGIHRLLYGDTPATVATAEADSLDAEQMLALGHTYTISYPDRASIASRFVVVGEITRKLADDRRRWLVDFEYLEITP